MRDLRPGCEYSVCLQIRAGSLTGAASEAATFRAPAAPPDRALPPRAQHRSRSAVQLRWSAPHDNGARILHYSLEMDSGEGFVEIATPRTRQHSVANLRPQTRYRFRLAAVNECGRGDWSQETIVWSASSPPPAPAPPALTAAHPDSLALSWERRADEEFTLQMDDVAHGHGFLPVYRGPECAHTCTGLRRASDYRFRLRCETDGGQGPWSTEVSYRTPPERPAAPPRPLPRGRPQSRAFRLRWDPPADDGGAPIQRYTLELDAGDGYRPAYAGPDRETTCDRLRPGTAYRARLCCANSAGESDWSSSETITTEATFPAACETPELVGEPRASHLALRWNPPACSGGAPLTEYRVELAAGDESTPRVAHAGPEPECVMRDLAAGRPYRVWVIACNRVGAGPPSPALAFSTAPGPPDAPDAPLVRLESPRSARLEWSSPHDNGTPVLDYRVEMSVASVDDSYAEVYRGIETSCVVNRLTPFTPYFFRVCATNAAGRGAWSPVRDALTARSAPAAPTGLRHEATADAIRLQWRAPVCYGADVLRYRLQVGETILETDGTVLERLVEELEPDTEYVVRVAALSELGLGEWSEACRAQTRPPPPQPPALRCAPPAHNHLRLEWEPSGGEGAHYCVEMRSAEARDFRPVYRGCARSCKVKKLREATLYSFRIRVTDERGGRGAWSEPCAYATAAAPPPAPRTPAATYPAPRAALLAWDPVDDADYVLQCARAKDALYKQACSNLNSVHVTNVKTFKYCSPITYK